LFRKEWIVATHTKPDEDAIVSVALLKWVGVRIKGYWFHKEGDTTLPPQLQFENVLWVDRGHRVFDHHGIKGKTSVLLVTEELGINNEKWIQPIIRHVHRSDLEGRSEPMDLNDIIKSISRELSDDEKIMQLGIEIATAIIEFHKNTIKRDNRKAAMIIREFFGDETKMPEKIRHYFELLQNPDFARACDFAELATVNPDLAKEAVKFIGADIKKYEAAQEDVEKAQKIRVGRYLIIAGVSNNPKFNPRARAMGAAIVVQKNLDGHVQIYFNNKVFPPETMERISEDLVEILRLREISLDHSKKLPTRKSDLRTAERLLDVPEWYFFKGEGGGRLILNGSLTAPDVPITKIDFQEIVEFAVDALRNLKESVGRGAARRGAPPQKPRREGFGDKALSHQ
jgi:hypothetical protein